jgi:hypothetical protein
MTLPADPPDAEDKRRTRRVAGKTKYGWRAHRSKGDGPIFIPLAQRRTITLLMTVTVAAALVILSACSSDGSEATEQLEFEVSEIGPRFVKDETPLNSDDLPGRRIRISPPPPVPDSERTGASQKDGATIENRLYSVALWTRVPVFAEMYSIWPHWAAYWRSSRSFTHGEATRTQATPDSKL